MRIFCKNLKIDLNYIEWKKRVETNETRKASNRCIHHHGNRYYVKLLKTPIFQLLPTIFKIFNIIRKLIIIRYILINN